MTKRGCSLDNTMPFSRKTEKLLKKSTLKYIFFFVSLRENERLMTIPNVFVSVRGTHSPWWAIGVRGLQCGNYEK